MKCYNCDTEILNEWNYCPNCKRVIRKNKKGIEELVPCNETGKCHQCSYTLDSKWNFCPICSDPVDFYENSNVNIVVPVVGNTNKLDIKNNTGNTLNLDDKSTYEIVGYCTHCGSPVGEGHLFCAVCGAQMQQSVVNIQEVNNIKEKYKKQDRPGYGYIFFILLWAVLEFGPILLLFIDIDYNFLSIGFIAALVTILLAKHFYPNNKLVNAVLIMYIIITALGIIAYVAGMFFLFYSCYSCIAGWGG